MDFTHCKPTDLEKWITETYQSIGIQDNMSQAFLALQEIQAAQFSVKMELSRIVE
ncbi:hypothetical protein [Bacillus sp. 3255]|uniref:hypothetical protein n=1 Tax=Bacillus sp. 3255 TaxID=2817904 RepID=UPI00285CEB18|nr:hypothetical protein [Bacillus sp. 3255]MDR6878752.1 hypothetical protein [Bacillus sp. 3255]